MQQYVCGVCTFICGRHRRRQLLLLLMFSCYGFETDAQLHMRLKQAIICKQAINFRANLYRESLCSLQWMVEKGDRSANVGRMDANIWIIRRSFMGRKSRHVSNKLTDINDPIQLRLLSTSHAQKAKCRNLIGTKWCRQRYRVDGENSGHIWFGIS